MASRTRRANMAYLEDEALCHVYINVISNAVVGINQSFEIFLKTVRQEFQARPDITTTRTSGFF